MGVYYCSTGKHIAFISVSPMRSFTCECPKPNVQTWNVTPRVANPKPGYDFISKPRKRVKA